LEIDFCEIDEELFSILDEFEPYGEANERPIFAANGKKALNIKTIGHNIGFKAIIDCGAKKLKAVCFRTSSLPIESELISFKFSIYKNDYMDGAIELLIEEIVAS